MKTTIKATGVVRRIDDLGRIVIPKEIRRTLKIREGDQLEILVDHDGYICLKKYSPLGDLSNIAYAYIDAIKKNMDKKIIVTDLENVIASSKELYKKIDNKAIAKELEEIILRKEEFNTQNLKMTDDFSHEGICFVKPILSYGDVLGAIIVLSTDELSNEEIKQIDVLVSFFENYLSNY